MKKSDWLYYGPSLVMLLILGSLDPAWWQGVSIGILWGVAYYAGMLHAEEEYNRKG